MALVQVKDGSSLAIIQYRLGLLWPSSRTRLHSTLVQSRTSTGVVLLQFWTRSGPVKCSSKFSMELVLVLSGCSPELPSVYSCTSHVTSSPGLVRFQVQYGTGLVPDQFQCRTSEVIISGGEMGFQSCDRPERIQSKSGTSLDNNRASLGLVQIYYGTSLGPSWTSDGHMLVAFICVYFGNNTKK